MRYWRNLALFSLAAAAVGALFVLVWLANSSALSLLHPYRSLPHREPENAAWEEIYLRTSDDLRLAAWFHPPGESGAAVILVHGLGSNRGELIDEAQMLVAHGFGALLLDLRNHGSSEGELTTLGYFETRDIEAAASYLQGRSEVDPARVGLLGNSMGAVVVIRAAAQLPEVRALVAQSGLTSLQDNVGHSFEAVTGLPEFPFAPLVIQIGEWRAGVEIDRVRPIDDVRELRSQALLLIHGEDDEVVPVQNSIRLFDAAHEPKQLLIVKGAGHGGLLKADPARYEAVVTSFFQRYLAGD